METDKSATILEAQWMEREIPRIDQELRDLQAAEQELLTAPLETVRQAYTDAYRTRRKRAHPFYHRRRSVRATEGGYRARNREVGWFVILARILIALIIAAAGYVAYRDHQAGNTQKGVIWGSVLVMVALILAFAPAVGDLIWDRQSRRVAELAAQDARQSAEFQKEKQERQIQLEQCRARMADLEERKKFAGLRLDELRKELTSSNHQGGLGASGDEAW
jgi:hypothetical protein